MNNSSSIVRLGLMAPHSGLVALYGEEIERAAQIAAQEVNATGGIRGLPLKLIVIDDGSVPETAVPAALRLVEQYHCHAIIGNLLSNSRIAIAAQVSEPYKTPYLNFSFYEGSIYNPYFFNFAALPNQQIDKMIPYMANKYGPKFFFAGSNYEWPRGSIDAGKKALQECGGEVIGEEYLPLESADFANLLEKVARSGADVFVPYFAGSNQVTLLTRFSEKGLKDRMAVVMGHYDEAMVSNLPPIVRSDLYSSNTYFMPIANQNNRQFLEKLADYPDVTDNWPLGNGIITNFGEGAYTCVKAFAAAANVAQCLSSQHLIEALEEVSIETPQGRVAMDPLTHHATVNSFLARCDKSGCFRIIEEFGAIPAVIPTRYQHNISDIRPSLLAKKNQQFTSNTELHWKFIAITQLPDEKSHDYNIQFLDENNPFANSAKEITRLENFISTHAKDIQHTIKLGEQSVITSILQIEGGSRYEVMITPLSADKGSAQIAIYGRSVDTGNISQKMLAVMDSAILATNSNGEIIQASMMAGKLFGYKQSEIIGLSVHHLVPPRFRSKHKEHIQEFLQSNNLQRTMNRRGEVAGYRKDGSEFPAAVSLAKFNEEKEWYLIATVQDMTEQKEVESRLIWQATHDPLTQLANRALIMERIENALKRSQRKHSPIALLFIDIDDFKIINDSYGHDIGDKLLVTIGNRIMHAIRPGDTLARIGGDEFLILCDNIDSEHSISELAHKITQSIKQTVNLENINLQPTVSIGMTIGYGAANTAEGLIRNADLAMYDAKQKGRDNWRLFDHDIFVKAKQHLFIANALRDAIKKDELSVHLQPILSCAKGDIVGAEALVRWFSDDGPISPAVFIPIAEHTGIVEKIGLWVFEAVCKSVNQWITRFHHIELPYVSVNISARQLGSDSIVSDLLRITTDYDIDTSILLLEVTETAMMTDVENSIRVLNELGDAGFSIAIDDFGTGYSSLGQLLRLPVAGLKIDRIFVDGAEKSENSKKIVSTVIKLAHEFNLKVIAEGVENLEQHNLLNDLQCDNVQGFHFHRPMPISEFETLYFENPKLMNQA